MILIDINLLVYASFTVTPQHVDARRWLDQQFDGPSRVGLPWSSLLGFLRIATHPRIFAEPASTHAAWSRILTWLALDPVWIPQATESHSEVLGRLLAVPGMGGNLVHDADLAALAIEHGLTLYSTDGDFARFPGLRWQNPLAG